MQPQPLYGYLIQPDEAHAYLDAPAPIGPQQYHVQSSPQGTIPPVIIPLAPCSRLPRGAKQGSQAPLFADEPLGDGHRDWCGYLDNTLTLIDNQHPSVDEAEYLDFLPEPCLSEPCFSEPLQPVHSSAVKQLKLADADRSLGPAPKKTARRHVPRRLPALATTAASNYFSKVDLYANSKLPLGLPRLVLDVKAWPLICLASQYSQRVYSPNAAERDALVPSDWRSGAKTMYVQSIPADDARTVVVAIRGTASFADWAVNLRAEPATSEGFLDDCGNACHAGFLDVARTMVAPVAARLRRILEQDPARTAHSLVLTGHSAGGAVASLVYMHMLARQASCQSELSALTTCFSSIHCITFGAPPVSLLPLQKPHRPELRSSLFLTFVNQGDPVARAGKAYIKSLVELLRSPPPSLPPPCRPAQTYPPASSRRWLQKPWAKSNRPVPRPAFSTPTAPLWDVPPCLLSNAGLIVVLRSDSPASAHCRSVKQIMDQGVVAVTSSDEQLRRVIWGDPLHHVMKLYAARVEALAVEAVVREMD